jgi:hypothetical protein
MTAIAFIPAIQVNRVIMDGNDVIAVDDVLVTLEYVHSVELMRIVETYTVSNCKITLTNFTWSGAGAGLPTLTDSPNHIRHISRGYSLENITLPLRLAIDVKYRLNPRITVNGEEVLVKDRLIVEACSHESLAEIIRCRIEGCLIG